jgi:hypothetical protein
LLEPQPPLFDEQCDLPKGNGGNRETAFIVRTMPPYLWS